MRRNAWRLPLLLRLLQLLGRLLQLLLRQLLLLLLLLGQSPLSPHRLLLLLPLPLLLLRHGQRACVHVWPLMTRWAAGKAATGTVAVAAGEAATGSSGHGGSSSR